MLEAAFSVTMGASSGPEIQIFKQFKAFWPNIVFTDYMLGIEVEVITDALTDVIHHLKDFITHQLEMRHQHEDY